MDDIANLTVSQFDRRIKDISIILTVEAGGEVHNPVEEVARRSANPPDKWKKAMGLVQPPEEKYKTFRKW